MDKSRNRTIKMTDLEYNTMRQGAIERNLTSGQYIYLVCTEYGEHSSVISPEIICRLQTIRNLQNVSRDDWNAEMKAIFDTNMEELCVLLKW